MRSIPGRRFSTACAAPASPGRLRRPRLLVVGCGDVGLRLLRQFQARLAAGRLAIVAVTRDPARRAEARRLGARTLAVDLGDRRAAARLGGLAGWTVHLAPPPEQGRDDPRLGHLIAARGRATAALARRGLARPSDSPPARSLRRPRLGAAPARWTLIGTTGVYGDCGGALVDETRPVAPATDRARRRVAAENRVRAAVRNGLLHASVLRVPGIYAHDRLPVDRLRRGTPALRADEDTYTNHVHADDLARIAWLALFRGRPCRAVNAVDDSDLKMGEWFDRVADALDLPRPPRLPRAALAAQVSPVMLSFMSESRRLANRRLKEELRVRLRWPTVNTALAEVASARRADGRGPIARA